MALSDAQLDSAVVAFQRRFGVALWDSSPRPSTTQIRNAFQTMDTTLEQPVSVLAAGDPDKRALQHVLDSVNIPGAYERWMLAEILRQMSSDL